jgi:protein gp37
MGENTKISWCDSTFNPWFGCEPVSPGCANCYARGVWARLGLKPGERRRSSVANWKQPIKWNNAGLIDSRRRSVFCGSLMDWLDPEVPVEWLAEHQKTHECN